MSPQQTPRVEAGLPSLALSLPARPGLGEEITSVCPRLGSWERPSPPGYCDGVAHPFPACNLRGVGWLSPEWEECWIMGYWGLICGCSSRRVPSLANGAASHEAAQKTHAVTRATGIMPVPPESLQGVSGASILLQWGGRCSFGPPGARERAGDRELACGNVRKAALE